MYRVAKLLSLISTGFLAGVFTYAFFAIIPAWDEVPRQVHFTYRVALMRHNAVVMQSGHLRRGGQHHEFDRRGRNPLRKCAH
jgi:hypothetical protein